MEYKKKWDQYKIGDVEWININKEHTCRNKYIEYVLNSSFNKILEIGGGELLEAQRIISNKGIRYSVIDVSKTFLQHYKKMGVEFKEGDMIKIPYPDKEFDLVYMSSVIEHSPGIKKTILELKRVSSFFYINMFKWRMKTGGLKSLYVKNKKYYSSYFNIWKLIDLFSKFSSIERMFLSNRDGKNPEIIEFSEYKYDGDEHRTGWYLTIIGKWRQN
ncbi:MAG: class I SAM-dependent methyltransferase [Candidatus Woesearchaeota archaeon]|jgi:ubiquinone/menaquinone biosynthesis C-methylase UbiE